MAKTIKTATTKTPVAPTGERAELAQREAQLKADKAALRTREQELRAEQAKAAHKSLEQLDAEEDGKIGSWLMLNTTAMVVAREKTGQSRADAIAAILAKFEAHITQHLTSRDAKIAKRAAKASKEEAKVAKE